MELCVDAFVPNDSSLVGGRGVGWNGDKEGMDVAEDGESIDPNMSMLIVTVRPGSFARVLGTETACREPTTAGRASCSSRSLC